MEQESGMIVGITDTLGSEHKFRKYIDWLSGGGADVQCRTLSYRFDGVRALASCDALLLSGGHDVDPTLYGGAKGHPAIVDVDRKRDDFESALLGQALEREIPILGVCRGMQLANVYFGGTLIPDLEEQGYANHRSHKDAERRHSLILESQSDLHGSTGLIAGEVNTSHHQAVLEPGDGLRVAARSVDGVIEAMELAETDRKNFFLLVQWHPERMTDAQNPLTGVVRSSFMSAIRSNIHT